MAFEQGLSNLRKAEPESESKANKAGPLAAIGEPFPEWDTAIHRWGFAWVFYQYGFGAAFGILTLSIAIFLVRILRLKRSARPKRATLIVLIMLLLFGLSRCLFLCVDAYNIKGIYPRAVSNIFWSLGNPCIITAYTLIFLVLRNIFFMRERFQKWYTGRNVALTTIPYFLLVFTAELVFFVSPRFQGLTFACQITSVILGMMLSSFYAFVAYLLWKNYKGKNTDQVTLKRQQPAWTNTKKISYRSRRTLAILRTCIAAVIGGTILCTLQIYSMSGVYGVFSSTEFVEAWPWLIFNYAMRSLELFLALVLYVASTSGARQQTAYSNSHHNSFAASLRVPSHREGGGSRRSTRLLSLSFQSSNAVADVA